MCVLLNGKEIEIDDIDADQFLGKLVRIEFDCPKEISIGYVVAVVFTKKYLWAVWYDVGHECETEKEAINKTIETSAKYKIEPKSFGSFDASLKYLRKKCRALGFEDCPHTYISLSDRLVRIDIMGRV